MALPADPLIGTTEPSNSDPGSSDDRHAQLLTATGNFVIIWNLVKIAGRVKRYNIGDHT